MEVNMEDCFILINEKEGQQHERLLPILETDCQDGKPLRLLPKTSKAKRWPTLVVNKLRGDLHVAAVKAPGFGDAARPCWKTSRFLPAAK